MPHFKKPCFRTMVEVSFLIFALFLLSSCGGSNGSTNSAPPPPTLRSITVSSQSASVAAGLSDQFTATGTFSDGTTSVLTNATWSSSDPTLATINSAGLVSTLKAGTVTVTATSGSVTGNGSLTVGPAVLKTINVSGQTTTVAAGLTNQLTASAIFTDGSSPQLTGITWSTSDTTLATVDTDGLVTTLKQGTVTITATSSSNSGAFQLTIAPPALESINLSPQNTSVAAGLTDQFVAIGTFSDGSSNTLTNVTWSTSDPTLATVNSTGLVTTLKPGNPNVIATVAPVTESFSLTIAPPIPVALSITPGLSVLKLGSTPSVALKAVLTFSDQSTSDVTNQATWNSITSNVATVDATGSVTALKGGHAIISADDQSFSSRATVTVLQSPRYLYSSSDAGRLISQKTIDVNTGQLRSEGYTITNANNLISDCITIDPAGHFLYMGATLNSLNGGEILGYSIDQNTGALTPISGSPWPTTIPTGCIQFGPNENFAYASSGSTISDGILVLSWNSSTGTLTEANSYTLSSPPSQLAIDPLGKYLYVVGVFVGGNNPALVYGYSIDPTTGLLTPIAGTPFVPASTATNFAFHPSGSFIYLSNSGGESINSYSVDRNTGKITSIGSITTCVNPSTLQFSADGHFAYATCSMDDAHDANSASVESFSVASNGVLTNIGSAPSGVNSFDFEIDPSGQFLYENDLTLYQIGASGIARFAQKSATELDPMTLAMEGGTSPVTYTPKFAYVTSTADNKLTTYAIQPDGTFGPGQSVSTQLSPFSLSTLPWGSDLFVASSELAPNLTPYTLDGVTGLLSFGPQFGNATSSGGVAIDPSGKWAFETDSTNGVIYTYGNFSGWGLLSYSPDGINFTTTFAAGAGAGPMIVDPSGTFLYVANQTADSISAYEYFSTSPELFEATGSLVQPYTDGSPYPLGAKPLTFAIDPADAFLYVLCDDQTVRVFSIDRSSAGHLAPVASVSLAGQAAGLAVEPTGRFVYTGDSTGVNAYLVDAQTGNLTAIPLNPAITLADISGVYVEPSGKYLYVATSTSGVGGAIYAYTINNDGTLSAVSSSPIATPNLPSSMAFTADIQ